MPVSVSRRGRSLPMGDSFLIFSPTNRIRVFLYRLTHHKFQGNRIFPVVQFYTILLHFILATIYPFRDMRVTKPYFSTNSAIGGSTFTLVLDALLTVLFIYFTIALLIQCIVYGALFNGPRSYLRKSVFSVLEVISVISFWIDFKLMAAGIPIYVFRMLSILHCFQLVMGTRDLRGIARGLTAAIPLLLNVSIFVMFFFGLFVIVGVVAFQGSFRRSCVIFPNTNGNTTDPPADLSNFTLAFPQNLCGSYFAADGKTILAPVGSNQIPKGYTCPAGQFCIDTGVNPNHGFNSFDNVLYAMINLANSISTENWSTLMYFSMQSEFSFASLYWIALIIVMSYLVVNLFVAVILETFGERSATHSTSLSASNSMRKGGGAGGGANLNHEESLEEDELESMTTKSLNTVPNNNQSMRTERLKSVNSLHSPGKRVAATIRFMGEGEQTLTEPAENNEGTDALERKDSKRMVNEISYKDSNPFLELEEEENLPGSDYLSLPKPGDQGSSISPASTSSQPAVANQSSMVEAAESPVKNGWLLSMRKVISSSLYEALYIGAVSADFIFLGLKDFRNDSLFNTLLGYVESGFTLVFALEYALKMFILGSVDPVTGSFDVVFMFQRFFHRRRGTSLDWINVMDGFLVIATVILQIPFIRNSRLFDFLVIFNIFRFYRVVLYFDRTRILLGQLFQNLKSTLNLFLFYTILLLVSATAGMQMLAGTYFVKGDGKDGSDGPSPFQNFNNFGNSVLSLFQVTTEENWDVLVTDAMRYQPDVFSRIIAGLFIAMFDIFMDFIVVNMLVAVIMENIEMNDADKKRTQVILYVNKIGGVFSTHQVDPSSANNPAFLDSLEQAAKSGEIVRNPAVAAELVKKSAGDAYRLFKGIAKNLVMQNISHYNQDNQGGGKKGDSAGERRSSMTADRKRQSHNYFYLALESNAGPSTSIAAEAQIFPSLDIIPDEEESTSGGKRIKGKEPASSNQNSTIVNTNNNNNGALLATPNASKLLRGPSLWKRVRNNNSLGSIEEIKMNNLSGSASSQNGTPPRSGSTLNHHSLIHSNSMEHGHFSNNNIVSTLDIDGELPKSWRELLDHIFVLVERENPLLLRSKRSERWVVRLDNNKNTSIKNLTIRINTTLVSTPGPASSAMESPGGPNAFRKSTSWKNIGGGIGEESQTYPNSSSVISNSQNASISNSREFLTGANAGSSNQNNSTIASLSGTRTLGIFQFDNSIRQFCLCLLGDEEILSLAADISAKRHRYVTRLSQTFQWIVILSIIGSNVTALLETPHSRSIFLMQTGSPKRPIFTGFDLFFLLVFTTELVVKCIAYGFWKYLKSGWNRLDFVVLIGMYISIFGDFLDTSGVSRFFRGLRSLRPLRIVSYFPGLKRIFNDMYAGIGRIFDASLVSFAFVLPLAIYGIYLFNGRFYFCNDPSITKQHDCVGNWVNPNMGNILMPRVWDNANYNFDHMGEALLTMFVLSSTVTWISILSNVMAVTDIGLQPIIRNSPGFSVYLVIVMVFVYFIVSNLFVGVIIYNFQVQSGNALLSKDQQRWSDLVTRLRQLRPSPKPIPPPDTSPFRAWCYRMVKDKKKGPLARFIVILVTFLLLVLATDTSSANGNSGHLVGSWQKYFYLAVCILFCIEVDVKIIGHGYRKWSYRTTNWFEAITSVGALISSILYLFNWSSASGSSRVFYVGLLVYLQRIFLVLAATRFVTNSERLGTLFKTLRTSVRPVMEVSVVFFVLMFIYALLFMEQFGLLPLLTSSQDLPLVGFRDVGVGLLTLFRMTTGENWDLIMADVVNTKGPFCVILGPTSALNNKIDPNFYQSLLTDCASPFWAYLLFISFYLLCTYIFLNLFITIIVDNFAYCTKSETGLVTKNELKDFKALWQVYDPSCTGYITLSDAYRLLYKLEGSFKVRIYDEEEWTIKGIKAKCVRLDAVRRRPANSFLGSPIATVEAPTAAQQAIEGNLVKRFMSNLSFNNAALSSSNNNVLNISAPTPAILVSSPHDEPTTNNSTSENPMSNSLSLSVATSMPPVIFTGSNNSPNSPLSPAVNAAAAPSPRGSLRVLKQLARDASFRFRTRSSNAPSIMLDQNSVFSALPLESIVQSLKQVFGTVANKETALLPVGGEQEDEQEKEFPAARFEERRQLFNQIYTELSFCATQQDGTRNKISFYGLLETLAYNLFPMDQYLEVEEALKRRHELVLIHERQAQDKIKAVIETVKARWRFLRHLRKKSKAESSDGGNSRGNDDDKRSFNIRGSSTSRISNNNRENINRGNMDTTAESVVIVEPKTRKTESIILDQGNSTTTNNANHEDLRNILFSSSSTATSPSFGNSSKLSPYEDASLPRPIAKSRSPSPANSTGTVPSPPRELNQSPAMEELLARGENGIPPPFYADDTK